MEITISPEPLKKSLIEYAEKCNDEEQLISTHRMLSQLTEEDLRK